MECICGCGREVPRRLTEVSLAAGEVATELLVWDRERTFNGPESSTADELIDRGAALYKRLLAALHGEASADPDESCDAWLKESARLRADRPEMTRGGFFADGSPKLEPSDLQRLDHRHPERSFSQDRSAGREWNLVDELARLGDLRDAGVLTAAEFETAKSRLLGA